VNKTLYVGNLSARTKAHELRQVFAAYGTVTKVEIPADLAIGLSQGFGFVEMSDGADAAIAAVNGASFQGRTLVVTEAKPFGGPVASNRLSQVMERFATVCDYPESAEFVKAVGDLREMAEGGDADGARELADVLARPGPHYDPESAYKWYYIAFSQRGYGIAFEDQNGTPPYYCGPVGDFRNESMVSDLVGKLGFDKVRSLDGQAACWLFDKGLSPRPAPLWSDTERKTRKK
jgi:RNA recognition motif-containing protein